MPRRQPGGMDAGVCVEQGTRPAGPPDGGGACGPAPGGNVVEQTN